MRLWTLNKWLRRVGLVLTVVTTDDPDGDSELWLERSKTYDARINPPPSSKQIESWIHKLPNIRKWMGERMVSATSPRETLSNPLPDAVMAGLVFGHAVPSHEVPVERVQAWAEGSRLVWTCLECGARSHAETGEETEQNVVCWRGHSTRVVVPPDPAEVTP